MSLTDVRLPLSSPTDDIREVVSRVHNALNRLPDNHHAIAARFVGYGLTGEPSVSFGDPLSQYLSRIAGHDIFTGNHELSASGGGWTFTLNLPAPVRDFVTEFDAGNYPALIEGLGDHA